MAKINNLLKKYLKTIFNNKLDLVIDNIETKYNCQNIDYHVISDTSIKIFGNVKLNRYYNGDNEGRGTVEIYLNGTLLHKYMTFKEEYFDFVECKKVKDIYEELKLENISKTDFF